MTTSYEYLVPFQCPLVTTQKPILGNNYPSDILTGKYVLLILLNSICDSNMGRQSIPMYTNIILQLPHPQMWAQAIIFITYVESMRLAINYRPKVNTLEPIRFSLTGIWNWDKKRLVVLPAAGPVTNSVDERQLCFLHLV